jgi:hypothetical protein
MDEHTIIAYLEELAERFGIEIRYEVIRRDEDLSFVAGGLRLLKGKYFLMINSKATVKDRIKTFAMAVKHFDLDQIYIRPVLRELFYRISEQRPFGNFSDGR